MHNLKYGFYRLIRSAGLLLYPKTQILGLENLPEEPCVVVSNHCQIHGPIVSELFFPGRRFIWCTHEMMHLKEVPAYAFQDFWSRKPRHTHWFYRLLSYLIAPLSVCLFGAADTIPVYRDNRVTHTFRQTLRTLQDGANVILFPEHDAPRNHIVMDFQVGFVDVARMYYKQTGKILRFVPMYVAPALHKAFLGKPIAYCPDNPPKAERRRICDYLMDQITAIAQGLPRHRVVPYLNLSKKEHGCNIPTEEAFL